MHLIKSKSRQFTLQPHPPLLVRNSTRNTSTFLSSFSYDTNVHDLFITFYCVEKINYLAPNVSRKADQIQRQCSLFRVANTAIKGDFETIALPPNKGLLIQEGNSNSLL